MNSRSINSSQVESLGKSTSALHDQTTKLTGGRLIYTYSKLALGYFLSYLDQTSVATITTAIAIEFNAGARYVHCTVYPKVADHSIEWVGASFLVTKYTAEIVHTNISTTFQLVWGRLSDIFGRKIILMTCLVIFMLGDLLCGFSQSAIQLYIFRAIAGIGGGGINSLCKIIISDIVSLKDRGKVCDILDCTNPVCWHYGHRCGAWIWGGNCRGDFHC